MTGDLVGHRNLGDAFFERVAAHPERTAVTVYRGSAAEEHESITFGRLARRAERRAARLAVRFDQGERVLIALPSGIEFVETYLACLLAGLVAVPVPEPGGGSNTVDRLAAIVEDCTPALAITTANHTQSLADGLERAGVTRTLVEAVTAEDGAEPDGEDRAGSRACRPVPGPDTLAVLQYSSGSTGRPKGAMLAHRNILADIQDFGEVTGAGEDDVFGIWLPLHHDMGLFGQLTAALLFGAPIVLMQPTDFVRRPVEWLRMMTRYRVTVTAGPNFSYDLCRRVIPDALLKDVDLSRLRIAFNGAEPIHAPTLAAFTERFAAVGVRPEVVSPAYGMAEATVFVCANPQGVPATVVVADLDRLEDAERPRLVAAAGDLPADRARELVGVGRPGVLEARIVDPATGREVPEQAVGEVWLRGPSIGSGYWNQPEATANAYDRVLATASDDAAGEREAGEAGEVSGGWLRTGDLGAFLAGELFITGRLKEMMIVRGRNLFPQDLEHEARAAHPGLTGFVGAAFGIATPEERVVLVHEVDPKLPAADLPAVADSVARRLSQVFGVPVRNVMLVRRGTVRRTTSGKIQRGAMRERFLAGRVEALHAELEPEVRRMQPEGVR